jgi:uncharacterized membrane protein YdbT with pleckstrin-like domain
MLDRFKIELFETKNSLRETKVSYPTVEQLRNQPPGVPFLIRTHPTLFACFGTVLGLVATSLVAVMIMIKACGSGSEADSCSPNIMRLIGLIPFGFFLSVVHFRFNNAYVFDDTNISSQEGRISLNYRNPTIRYADIKGITVSQSFWGRVFNYGTIALGTAANEGNELTIKCIGSPYALAELIEELRRVNLDLDDWQNL